MPVIKPTVGRNLWFRPHANDVLAFSDQPLCAFIAYVHGDRMLNLTVLDSNGGMHPRTSVTLRQSDDPAPEGCSYAEWMPYQQGQAAKTEALQAQLAGAAPVDSPSISTSSGDVETHSDDVTSTPKADDVPADVPSDGNAV